MLPGSDHYTQTSPTSPSICRPQRSRNFFLSRLLIFVLLLNALAVIKTIFICIVINWFMIVLRIYFRMCV